MPKNKFINLLPQEEFNTSTTGRILKWATGTFRIIVIATEMVVMGAFLSRFWLDAQNSNINNAIKIKAAQVSAQAEVEKTFRALQSKLNIIDKISSGHNTTIIIGKITAAVPQTVTLSKIFISGKTIEIRGSSFSDNDIAQFMYGLQNGALKNVELEQVSSAANNSGETNFVISAGY